MSNSSPDVVLYSLFLNARELLDKIPSEALARSSRFLKRAPRKIPIPDFLAALIAAGSETHPSLERLAAVIGLAAGTTYTKQALQKRLGPPIQDFLIQAATSWLKTTAFSGSGWLNSFRRVLLQDSTSAPLPEGLAQAFPGSKNQKRKQGANLKLQFVTDLIGASVLHWSLSGFTRNDQAASVDILELAQPGDLILRDLGYFSLEVFKRLTVLGAFFLTRCKYGLNFYDPKTGKPIDLIRQLKADPHFDATVLVGEEKIPLRLVAQPVSDSVANERRRKARQNRDKRLNPSRERLFLMGWNIFLTNVSKEVWPAKALFWVYRLRWRIEIIFKAWKSHLRFIEFNKRNELMVRLSVLTKLLFCMMVAKCSDNLESLFGKHRHVSLLRVARIFGHCACFLSAAFLRVTPEKWMACQIRTHIFYEVRQDRKNFYQLLSFVDSRLLG